MSILASMVILPALSASFAQDTASARVWGLQLFAEDVEACERFYLQGLGFESAGAGQRSGSTVLRSGDARLVLTSVPGANPGGPTINFVVGDLQAARRRAVKAGAIVRDDAVQPNAIGQHVEVFDPAGHRIHLLKLANNSMDSDSPPRFFNFGLREDDLERAESFLTRLGLRVLTRAYLPRTLVFARDGGASIVVHRAEAPRQARSGAALLIRCDSEPQELEARGIVLVKREAALSSGQVWASKTPSGYAVKLSQLP